MDSEIDLCSFLCLSCLSNIEFYERVDADTSSGFGGIKGRGSKKQDPPVERELILSLEEIYHGCTKKMKISRRVRTSSYFVICFERVFNQVMNCIGKELIELNVLFVNGYCTSDTHFEIDLKADRMSNFFSLYTRMVSVGTPEINQHYSYAEVKD